MLARVMVSSPRVSLCPLLSRQSTDNQIVAGLENSLDRRGERDDPRVELPKSENHAKILLTRSIIHNSIRIKIYMKEVEKVT